MKQRILTGAAIIATLILVLFARELTSYIFDAFILILAVVASYEMSKLLAKQGLYNNIIFACIYPVISYALYLIGLLCHLKWYMILVMQIGAIILFVGALILYGLIQVKKTKNEIETRKLKLKSETFSVFKSVHTMFIYLYPTSLMLFFVLLNNLGSMGYLFTNSVQYLKEISLFAVILTLVIPIFADTFAYLTGSLIKGPKLCPKVSPNKTISGAIGGIIWGTVGAVVVYLIFNALPIYAEAFAEIGLKFWHFIILGFVASILSECGDLLESYIKRKSNAKDSGTFLAGHGGILDRMDSHIVCAPIVFLFFVILL